MPKNKNKILLLRYLQNVVVSIIWQVSLWLNVRLILLDNIPDAIHVSAQIVRYKNDESVLLLKPIDHFLSIEDMLRSLSVCDNMTGSVIIIGRRFGVEAANVTDLFQSLQHPNISPDLFDATIQPLRLLRVPILRTRIIQDLDVGIHSLVDYLIRHVG